jgi:hypothetical protein
MTTSKLFLAREMAVALPNPAEAPVMMAMGLIELGFQQM